MSDEVVTDENLVLQSSQQMQKSI